MKTFTVRLMQTVTTYIDVDVMAEDEIRASLEAEDKAESGEYDSEFVNAEGRGDVEVEIKTHSIDGEPFVSL